MGLLLLDSDADIPAPAPAPDRYARMMLSLLPPGRLWRVAAGSMLYKFFLGIADELDRIDGRGVTLLAESDPRTTVELLPEYERQFDLVATSSEEERRARVVALEIQFQGFRPDDFREALSPLLAQAPEDIVVIERSHADAVAMGDEREIYRFFFYRNPALPGAYFVASAQAQVDSMAPSHTHGYVIESTSFLYDDPRSLYDRDLLGA